MSSLEASSGSFARNLVDYDSVQNPLRPDRHANTLYASLGCDQDRGVVRSLSPRDYVP